jgi:hypothetical protein
MKIVDRIKQGLPEDNKSTLVCIIKWFFFGIKSSAYIYGMCNGIYARKHKKRGNVQSILWKKGDQKYVDGIGHTKDKWHNFHSSWWDSFEHIPLSDLN